MGLMFYDLYEISSVLRILFMSTSIPRIIFVDHKMLWFFDTKLFRKPFFSRLLYESVRKVSCPSLRACFH